MNDMSIGLPRMHKEKGERRDFLPPFVQRLSDLGLQVVVEEGYGGGMDIPSSDYTHYTKNLRFASHEETYAQDLVLVLRYPNDDELHLLKRGACLVSMVHLPTRPGRVSQLVALGLEAVSLDSVKDDTGRRLVENLRAVSWNGMETAFAVLRRTFPDFESPSRPPLRVTILGSGGVGGFAMQAAVRYGNTTLWDEMVRQGVPGVRVTVVDYDVTGIEGEMRGILRETDLLVDATQRPDPTRIVIPNRWIAELPIHAVILDLSVDPYDCGVSPPCVKAIEGVPHGDLDRFIFLPEDSVFDDLPDCVSTNHRRPTVSCYSWPGIHPRACMETYGKQIFPLIRTMVDAGGASRIDPQGRYFHRALSRAMLSRWAAVQGVQL
jgi:alanine dehydrogenase